MPWIQNSPADLQGTQKQTYTELSARIPTTRGWFGLSAQRVREVAGGALQAASIASSLVLAIAHQVGAWIHFVLDLQQSLFIEAPIPKGNRWVEHLRNTYRDYGLPLPNFDQETEETFAEYATRLESYAEDLKDVFRKQSVTLEAIRDGLARVLPEGSIVTLIEPSSLVKPYPGARQYHADPLPGESNADYLARIQAYRELYQRNRWRDPDQFRTGRPNALYPVPATSLVVTDGYTETQAVLDARIKLLKSGLGSYTNLDGATRQYFGERNQGGRLEVILSADLPGAYDRINQLKAAGVMITVFVREDLGIAPSTATQAASTATGAILDLIEPGVSPSELLGGGPAASSVGALIGALEP